MVGHIGLLKSPQHRFVEGLGQPMVVIDLHPRYGDTHLGGFVVIELDAVSQEGQCHQ